MILVLAAVQLAPLPARIAGRLSPRSQEVHSLGMLPDLARADDPTLDVPAPGFNRTPITVDRPATLRWLFGALGCWTLFCVVSHFADRLQHALVVWGTVVAALFVGTIFGMIQLLGATEGFYGFLVPGHASWAPSLADLVEAPNTTALRPLVEPNGTPSTWPVARPDRPAPLAGLPGGPGSFLALGALALPLALGLSLQTLATRGGRESAWELVRVTNRAGLVALMIVLTFASAAVLGVISGPVLGLPLALGLILAGLPGAWPSGLRWMAVGLTALCLAGLGGGIALGEVVGRPEGAAALADRESWQATRAVWSETVRMARDFPLLGSGLGSFASLHPYYKAADAASTTARSSLLQWWAESGLAGLGIAVLAALWFLVRLPVVLRRVGSADRVLAFSLIGSVVAFGVISMIHGTIELAVVALAASAVGGTLERWLAGGTDLFVEPA
jgi:hypothetical protein